MSKQLSKLEIEKLFEFTLQKRVRYRDVQFEIVDHLASDIEEQMSVDHSLSFESALQNAYSKFPITGFAQFVMQKSEAFSKFWRRHFFSYFLEFLSLPKIVISILLVTCFYYLFRLQGTSAFSILYLSLIAFLFFKGFLSWGKHRYKIQDQKNFLFLSTYYQQVGSLIYFVVYLPIVVPGTIKFGNEMGFKLSLVTAILLTVYGIIIYACLYVFPHKLESEIKSKYQHLNFA